MLALALDMGGTHIGCGVVEEDRLLAHAAKVRRVRLGRSLCTMRRRLSVPAAVGKYTIRHMDLTSGQSARR